MPTTGDKKEENIYHNFASFLSRLFAIEKPGRLKKRKDIRNIVIGQPLAETFQHTAHGGKGEADPKLIPIQQAQEIIINKN
ncbi:hypothetical protein HDV04_005729 [Boothiomyces sp. JEL0838]|nr:hypothetical protein HDV04_005729 [Boothiomyces sp. JEL0838]